MFSATCLIQSSNIVHEKALHVWFNMLFCPSAPKTLIPVANPGEASNNVSHNNFSAFSSFFVADKYRTQHNRTTFSRFVKKCCILVT